MIEWPRAISIGNLWLGALSLSALLSVRNSVFAEQSTATTYQDHYLAGGQLAADISYGEGGTTDTSSLAHSLRIDGILSLIDHRSGDRSASFNENGVLIDSQWDTAAYGGWSVNAAAQTGGSDTHNSAGANSASTTVGRHAVLAIHQRDMAFDGGWKANNAIGDVNSVDINLLRALQRFYLPTTPILGLVSEWNGPGRTQFLGSVGQPGVFQGIRVPGFTTLGGSTSTLGAQWSPAPAWTLGGQWVTAHDVKSAPTLGSAHDQLFSSSSEIATALWQLPALRAQLSLINGRIAGLSSGQGAWLDATATVGKVQHGAGIFRVDPNLSWGNQPIISDAQGAYYRYSFQSRRWQSNAGVDYLTSLSGRGSTATFFSADSRFQWSRDRGLGAVMNLRQSNSHTGWSSEVYADQINSLGIGRGQLNYSQDNSGKDTVLTLDQSWKMRVGMRLSTSISLERLRQSGLAVGQVAQDHTALGFSLFGGGELTSRLALDSNIRWEHALQGVNAPAISANVALTWQLSPLWSLLGTLYESRTGAWSSITIASPLAPPSALTTPANDDRGLFLTVRYQRAGGAHFAPLGGPPGTGWGQVSGTVYQDANKNGQLDAGEIGAPHITVLLDGRYSVQTDAQGHFEFPAVASGHHVLTAVADNLPLPWMIPGDNRTEITVETRQHTLQDIGAQKSNFTGN